MKNLNEVWGFVDSIVDRYRGVHELANAEPSFDGASNVRKALQQLEVIQDGIAEPFGCHWKVGPRVGQDLLEVRYRGFCDSNLEIHSGIIVRTSSMETVRRSLASVIPRSIDARVSASTSTASVAGTCSFRSTMPYSSPDQEVMAITPGSSGGGGLAAEAVDTQCVRYDGGVQSLMRELILLGHLS